MNSINNPNQSIRFGENVERGAENSNFVFPFLYNFVHVEDDLWDQVKGDGTAANLTGIGPTVASGNTIDWNIRIDPDYAYKIKFLRYTAYWLDSQNGIYVWYEPITGWDTYPDYQTHIGTPLVNSIKISLSSLGPNSRYIYGGDNIDRFMNAGGNLQPVRAETLQGYDYGIGQLNTPYLIPKEGLLRFRITNDHSVKDLVVGGAVYGFKIRV